MRAKIIHLNQRVDMLFVGRFFRSLPLLAGLDLHAATLRATGYEFLTSLAEKRRFKLVD